MRRVIEMAVEVNIAEDRTSANEVFSAVGLVLQSIYEQLTAVVLEAYQEQIVGILCSPSGLKAKKGLGWHEDKRRPGHRCRCRRFERAGNRHRDRRFRGERGDVSMRPAMVKCRGCGRRLTPLVAALELAPRQTGTDVLLSKVVEAIADTSYRRSMDQLSVLAEVPVAKSTAHRWAASVELPTARTDEGDVLGADGTGFKKRFGEKGTVRLVLKIGPEMKVEPVGVWAGSSWERIGVDIRDVQSGQGRLLVSDGEKGLESEDVEFVAEREKGEIRNRIRQAQKEMDALCEEFDAKGYPKASVYLRHARDQLFSHLNLWLDTGIIAPRTTSIIENIIRELVRRLKKIGWNWSDQGATRMGRIVMIRRYDPEAWIRYWNERINLRGRCHIRLLSCQLQRAA